LPGERIDSKGEPHFVYALAYRASREVHWIIIRGGNTRDSTLGGRLGPILPDGDIDTRAINLLGTVHTHKRTDDLRHGSTLIPHSTGVVDDTGEVRGVVILTNVAGMRSGACACWGHSDHQLEQHERQQSAEQGATPPMRRPAWRLTHAVEGSGIVEGAHRDHIL